MYDKMSVISQKGESQNGCCKKKKHARFSEKRNVHFSENLGCFVFLKYPFWDSPFCLITNEKILRFNNITRNVSQKMRFTRRNPETEFHRNLEIFTMPGSVFAEIHANTLIELVNFQIIFASNDSNVWRLTLDVFLMSLLVTLKRIHILFWCFHNWLGISK